MATYIYRKMSDLLMIKRFFYCFTSANLSNRNKKGSWDLFMGVDRKALKSDSVSYAKCGFY